VGRWGGIKLRIGCIGDNLLMQLYRFKNNKLWLWPKDEELKAQASDDIKVEDLVLCTYLRDEPVWNPIYREKEF
jgi:hypothetical protein